MAKSLIPKSKAKTAYGLLSEVARVVTEEPKRFDMRVWVDHVTPNGGRRYGGREYPACGTIGCIGGWVETLRDVDSGAAGILGLTESQAQKLFTPQGWRLAVGGTIAHARKYVAHLRRFQKKYAKQLKAKKLEAT